MSKLAFPTALAILVSVVTIGVIRENVTAVNSHIAKTFNPTPKPPGHPPDPTPVAMALVVETAASTSAGPAPVFAAMVFPSVQQMVLATSVRLTGAFGPFPDR